MGKPGTGKSQVLIHTIDHAICTEMSVLVAAPLALLAQAYNSIFLEDIDSDTLHAAFNIPIEGPHPNDINYALNKYDLVVVDEASMISPAIFHTMASTFNRLNIRPVVVLAGDKCQQQPLETIDGHTTTTTHLHRPTPSPIRSTSSSASWTQSTRNFSTTYVSCPLASSK